MLYSATSRSAISIFHEYNRKLPRLPLNSRLFPHFVPAASMYVGDARTSTELPTSAVLRQGGNTTRMMLR